MAQYENNQFADATEEKGKRKTRASVSVIKKSIVYIPPTNEDASESDHDNKGNPSDDDDDRANDRDVDTDTTNEGTKNAVVPRRSTRKRGRPAKQSFNEMSESSSVKTGNKQKGGLPTESHRRSSRSASESASSRIAAQMFIVSGESTSLRANVGNWKETTKDRPSRSCNWS
ncbi:hypothetical protein RRF57_007394 [Xylaria bambusicola]|uniref:Uncharacterized protein n=1 Tax=Xylaria bambusicola TaxID=326684 RepID=A0AAN7UG38_9PEZI